MNALIALKLYKTVFWISLCMTVFGVGYNIFETIKRTNYADYPDVFIYRANNPGLYDTPVFDGISELERTSIVADKKSSAIRLFFDYEYHRLTYYALLIGQFLSLILLKKWLTWIFKPQNQT